MKQKPVREQYHGGEVWVNQTTDAIRHEECLCLNCALLDKDSPKNCCSITQELYKTIIKGNLALLVVRCPDWKPKPE
ncbi:MAG: hypothetical protein A2224_00140 [Candidatus Magasanikbacteria bacterium RIFOXYA2_FULL_40_20]|nr:MAG: hypothetical protein A2224_00140 [Candidatus Magasanikbacteria bacterium RIFOXYA2_FULL_40_20]